MSDFADLTFCIEELLLILFVKVVELELEGCCTGDMYLIWLLPLIIPFVWTFGEKFGDTFVEYFYYFRYPILLVSIFGIGV